MLERSIFVVRKLRLEWEMEEAKESGDRVGPRGIELGGSEGRKRD